VKTNEQKIYGRNACLSFAKAHPDLVIRAYCTNTSRGPLGFLLKYLSEQKRAYHIVENSELNKISESEHHEGFCLLISRPTVGSQEELFEALKVEKKTGKELILCLDGISNPHNLGSIVRTAAHFGIKRIALINIAEESQRSLVSGAFHRTAEGGAVHVQVYLIHSADQFLKTLQNSFEYKIAVTSSHGRGVSLNSTQLPSKLALVMGSEAHGISEDVLRLASLRICIDGTGHVESLNVASATAILLNEFARQNQRARSSLLSSKPTRAARPAGRKRSGS